MISLMALIFLFPDLILHQFTDLFKLIDAEFLFCCEKTGKRHVRVPEIVGYEAPEIGFCIIVFGDQGKIFIGPAVCFMADKSFLLPRIAPATLAKC